MYVHLFDMNSIFSRSFFQIIKRGIPDDSPIIDGIPAFALELTIKSFFHEIKVCKLANKACSHAVAIFDHPGKNFRDEIFAQYKAQRPPKPETFHEQLSMCLEVMKGINIATLQVPGVESDDVIGTIATKLSERNISSIIHSGDKDMLSLVNPVTQVYNGAKKMFFDDTDVENRFGVPPSKIIDYLALVGDGTDNVKGVYGVGEKTAASILELISFDEFIEAPDKLADSKIRGIKQIIDFIHNNKENVIMSKRLVSLKTDVKMDFNLKNAAFNPTRHMSISDAIKQSRSSQIR